MPPSRSLNLWLISPYHSGSHKAWALGYERHSRHRMQLLTMPGRFWKWRMHGGPIELAAQAHAQLSASGAPDAVIATDMLHLPVWSGLMHARLPASTPLLLYMHENQLTYPWRPGEKPDLTYAMMNWLSQLSADRIGFNSAYHRSVWFRELPKLLKHYPDYNHLALIDDVAARSDLLPVGIDCGTLQRDPSTAQRKGSAPLILWNQRWEYDKRPDRFFQLLYRLQDAGSDFRLAVAGENFRNVPHEFEIARQRLARRIVHWGYVDSYAEYAALLQQADLVISTADHEFFGVSVLEAITAGAFPLLPSRLSYPELIPDQLHPACLYTDEDDLYTKVRIRLEQPRPPPPSLQQHILRNFNWPVVAQQVDAWVSRAVEAALQSV